VAKPRLGLYANDAAEDAAMKLNLSLVFVLLALGGCYREDSSENTSRSARPSDEAMAAESRILARQCPN
jgi:hypothetical protein